jgi:hypothetical protein
MEMEKLSSHILQLVISNKEMLDKWICALDQVGIRVFEDLQVKGVEEFDQLVIVI